MSDEKNALGGPLKECCRKPMTGFFRDGRCRTCPEDVGAHVICVEVTAKFLQFSRAQGNDLSTPVPEYGFPGLKPGDRWCLCASRWKDAYDAGVAPPVVLAATEASVLGHVALKELQEHATA